MSGWASVWMGGGGMSLCACSFRPCLHLFKHLREEMEEKVHGGRKRRKKEELTAAVIPAVDV